MHFLFGPWGVQAPSPSFDNFLKPFLKGKISRSGEWERGKFDFNHYFAFLTIFLKKYNFLLSGIWFGSSRGSFSKKNCPKRTFSSNFVKLVSKILYLFLAEKIVVCCLFVVVCLLFVATFSDFGLLFFKTLFKGKNFAVRRVREG